MTQWNRRQFLESSLAAGVFLASSANSSRAVRAANETIRVGIIGMGGRGGEHLQQFKGLEGVAIAAVTDPDEGRAKSAQAKAPGSKAYTDLRKMLENPEIDAVTIASCNHWHCLAAIWAMQAGKDVYVEKPLSHSQWEGRQVVNAARKYKRVVQLGTQQRSSPIQEEARQLLHVEKALGEIQCVQVCRYGIRSSIGKRNDPLPIPEGVDYDLWLGPAQEQPIYRNKLHYDWHWDWNTGSGEMGNWGVHVLDDVRNVVFQDEVTLPTRILAGGGRLHWNDAGNTPNVHFAYFDTGKIPTYIGLSNLPAEPDSKKSPSYRGVGTGYLVQCEGGYYSGRRGGGDAFDNEGKKIRSLRGSSGSSHARNFIETVRSRETDQLKAEIAVGHDSTGWCNLANIGFRCG
ncbi:MAG: Gfo/Idh/MocA family oxidoreductase, partial [Planctomycetaceae bacterium]|nr:Gfo/Idh/MocA family oxidoreductase [Planctomycetaceae bacterium]